MTTQEFIFNVPLYQKVIKDADQIYDDLVDEYAEYGNHITFDGYNPMRDKDSTYCVSSRLANRYEIRNHSYRHDQFCESDIRFCTLKCRRYGDEIELCLWLDARDHSIMKVGQYPSVADIHIGQIKQYAKLLSKEDLREFTRAIGLAANGVGIGSFVYLRRIFENQIAEAFDAALEKGEITREEFTPKRMDEKIEMLKNYLPETLVEARSIYGILSKGIHSLTEEECLLHFDVVRRGLEMILDDKLEQKKKAEKRKQTLASISAIKAKLGKE